MTDGPTGAGHIYRDDRGGPDPVGNDGIYTGYFHPKETGEYQFTAAISGGEVSGLQRDFTRQLSVTEVTDPIQQEKAKKESSPSLLDQLMQYGPVGGVAAVAVVLVAALVQRFRGGSSAAGGDVDTADGEAEAGGGEGGEE